MTQTNNSYDEVAGNNKDTVKISTVVFFTLGLIIPFWIVTLPLFWFLAYRSFKSKEGTPLNKVEIKFDEESTVPKKHSSNTKFEDIEKLKSLLDSGALTEEEFINEKSKLLNQ